jgi:formate-dependent nitrite reductase cytochrome c552 subunit
MILKNVGDCTACHHKDEKRNCADCHKTQQSLFDGESIFGLAKKPSAKSEGGVSCDACHGDMKKYSPDYLRKTCADCHVVKDDAYNLDKIKEAAAKLLEEAKEAREKAGLALKSAREAKRSGSEIEEAEKIMKEVVDMIDFAEKDGSLGLHNPAMWNELLKKSIEKSKKALELLQKKR